MEKITKKVLTFLRPCPKNGIELYHVNKILNKKVIKDIKEGNNYLERSKVIILIPSRNEYSTLRKILKKIHREYLILVIDDNSKDNTHNFLLKNKIPF